MSLPQLQKQSARNLVLSVNSQTAYGTVLADATLTRRIQFDPSSAFEKKQTRRSDQADVGKGTEFATNGQITGWDLSGTIKKDAEAWFLGWVFAFLFGQDAITGSAAPYTHAFTFPNIDATLTPTTVYVEDTNDVHFKALDICVATVSLSIPSRGAISMSVDLTGTGKWTPGSMETVPSVNALTAVDMLLGSDLILTITPSTGGAVIFSGRVQSGTVKIDNQAAPFDSVGDGLTSASVNSGTRKHSLDLQIAAMAADDVNGWFEGDTECLVSLATKNTLTNQLILTWPAAHIKANKVGNQKDLVIWSLSFDETTCYAKGGNPAITATVINGVAAYLAPPA